MDLDLDVVFNLDFDVDKEPPCWLRVEDQVEVEDQDRVQVHVPEDATV